MTKKEIEDFINKYRVYPKEYKGVRDEKVINLMNKTYTYDNGYINCQQGEINDAGNFVLTKEVRYPLSNPDDREEWIFSNTKPQPLKSYNRLVSEAGEYSKMIIRGEQNSTWNLRDMVAEIDVLKKLYLDVNSDLHKLQDSAPEQYRKTMYRLYRFIYRYRNHIDDLKTTVKHGSKYDT